MNFFKLIKKELAHPIEIFKKNKKNLFFYLWILISLNVFYFFWKIYILLTILLYLKILYIFIKKKNKIKLTGKISTLYYYSILNVLYSMKSANVSIFFYNILLLIFRLLFRLLFGYPYKLFKIIIVFFDTWGTVYVEDEIKKKKIFFKKHFILLKKTTEHVILTEIIKKKEIEKFIELKILNRKIEITVEIVDKNDEIEFKAFDYPYISESIYNYKIENITVIHSENEIRICCKKNDLFIAVNLFFLKYSFLSYPEQTEIFVEISGRDILVENDLEQTLILCEDCNASFYIFKIKSHLYNLKDESGIIVYYDSKYLYNNEILNKIIEQL